MSEDMIEDVIDDFYAKKDKLRKIDASVEKLKFDGAKEALIKRIYYLQIVLKNDIWDDVKNMGKFVKLTSAIEQSEEIIAEIKTLFAALKEMDPTHK